MDTELVNRYTILEAKHGSQAYGTNLPTSDLDTKGVCIIPDLRFWFGMQTFEQKDSGWGSDKVIYHLPKFLKIAGECNPNILEILFVEDQDILKMTPLGKRLRDSRQLFLSKKAKFTFSGYAHSELQKVKLRKKWMDNAPDHQPQEQEFKLRKKIDVGPLGTQLGSNTKIVKIETTERPDWFVLDVESFDKLGHEQAIKNYQSFRDWVTNRSPVKFEREQKFGFESKNAMHLVRLLRMGLEILTLGEVRVKRPDAQELLEIRNGNWTLDKIISYSEDLQLQLDEAYEKSSLPFTADWKAIEDLQIELVERAFKGEI